MSQSELRVLSQQVAALTQNIDFLVKRQQKQEELFEEMMPIAKLVMDSGVKKLDELERDGTMEFAQEVAGIGKRVIEGFSPADVRQLGDAVVGILDAVRALTQPEVLGVALDAAEALEDMDNIQPLGIFGMVRATKNDDVQRGMAVMMELLKRVGHGVHAMDTKKGERSSKKKNLAKLLGPRRKALGTERRLPAEHSAPPQVVVATAPVASKATVTIDGVEFCSNGHLSDPKAWSREIGEAIAGAEGLELTDKHWSLLTAAREDFLATGASPNIRRLTIITDMSTRDIYGLFPKAPGRSIARIAGCPKPAGCL